MRSGSSELLLEQQLQEQQYRARKLKENLAPNKKNANNNKRHRSWRERISFYTTSTLAFFSVTAGASLLFLVPLYVDPAISTLVADFVEIPTLCITTRREETAGLLNCSWSSCREGCTSDLYKCTHIYVQYLEVNLTTTLSAFSNGTASTNGTQLSTALPIITPAAAAAIMYNLTELNRSEEAILLVNIKGCGYPPSVKCKNFTEFYGQEGTIFPCFYSKQNRTIVMTTYKRDDQVTMIINFFAVPFVITIISSIALCIMHCDCRCKKERNPRRRGFIAAGVISSGGIGGSSGIGGSGIGFANNNLNNNNRRPRLENLRLVSLNKQKIKNYKTLPKMCEDIQFL